MPKKKTSKEEPKVHEQLEGFDIKINAFGVMETSFKIDELNEFLDKNVVDKKLTEREEEE